jgi:DNA topoisomerase IA
MKTTREDQTSDYRWGSYVSELLRNGVNVARGGVDMGDHPPITPCRYARAGELSGDMARVFELVTRHFIGSVSNDAVWMSTIVHLSIEALSDKGKFTVRGKQVSKGISITPMKNFFAVPIPLCFISSLKPRDFSQSCSTNNTETK